MRTLFLFVILLASFSVYAQTDLPIIGKISDIKEFKKAYIVTESTADRKEMLRALKSKKSDLQIVDNPDDAQFFIEFKTIARQDKGSILARQYNEDAEMSVYFFNTNKKKVVAWSESRTYFESSGISLSDSNSYALTRKFITALTKK